MNDSYYIKKTSSTNELLSKIIREYDLPEGFIVYTDYQTAGKGQGGNSWQSRSGKNLLFSMLLYPGHVPVHEQFIISQIVSIGIKRVLDQYTEHISIKWPNDIYWKDRKTAGILIENSLQGTNIKDAVIGIGININQCEFNEYINAVSLKQITGRTYARKKLLKQIKESILQIYTQWDKEKIRIEYARMLYRNSGYHCYSTPNETFEARIIQIRPDGRLILQEPSGRQRSFYFKEVSFV